MRVLALAVLALGGCGGGGTSAPPVVVAPSPTPTPAPTPSPTPSPTPTPVASIEREIVPSTTDAAIRTNLSPHVAINPSPTVAAKGRLFVMLPGTDGVPRLYKQILRVGAPRGYHAIGLTYPNDEAVGTLCAPSTDPACPEKVRREVITGIDLSPLVAVDAANSISGRLRSLLTYLHAQFPTEGWAQYLRAGAIDWSLVTVAGHSQGAGHAAFLAKLEVLDRAVMFAGPGDAGVTPGTSAAWLSLPNITPAARQYAFTHTADELVPFAFLRLNWARIGLDAFGATVSVDGNAAPYAGSHQLSTSVPPNPNPPIQTGGPNHGSPVIDPNTPLNAQGTPLFAPVWIYMAFP